ncbi:hypothetical protein PITC_095560 [Penicillium italicum]|uniref:Uncharacterized protein n=1 Tax=Penicillium italicum TaxID=40296 RepID=A0A0A2KNA3_PENIT|nr:hypothetical protein PITC_095560 [Penicillium italicum]
MSLVLLPTEVVLMIESNLDSHKDLNALICTSPRFARMFDDKLYKMNSAHQHAYVILWAAKRGLVGTIRKCLKAGAKVQRRDRFRSHLADRDDPESLKVIPRHPKSHPLTAAAEIGSMPCVRLLLKQGVSPNLMDEHYETPMRQAAGNGHVQIVQRLLYHDPSLFEGAFKLRRPLKIAAARGHLPVLKTIFSFLKHGDRILTVKDAAQIILYEGLWHCEEGVVRYALKKGADVNDQNSEFALRFAPDLQPRDSTELPRPILVQANKAREIIRGNSTPGWSYNVPCALHAALLGGDRDLVQLILDHGFDMGRVKNILRDACFRADTDIISRMPYAGVTLTSEMFQEFITGADLLWNSLLKKTIDKIKNEIGLKP